MMSMTNKRTRIISAFPGSGKSHFCKQNQDTALDSDSSLFSWIYIDGKSTGERNPDFPKNYIEHIKDNIGKYDYILVSSHKVVREALKDACLFFYLFYPKVDKKEEYIQRYKERGSSENLITVINDNWTHWIRDCQFDRYGCKNIELDFDFIENEINHIVCVENGEM